MQTAPRNESREAGEDPGVARDEGPRDDDNDNDAALEAEEDPELAQRSDRRNSRSGNGNNKADMKHKDAGNGKEKQPCPAKATQELPRAHDLPACEEPATQEAEPTTARATRARECDRQEETSASSNPKKMPCLARPGMESTVPLSPQSGSSLSTAAATTEAMLTGATSSAVSSSTVTATSPAPSTSTRPTTLTPPSTASQAVPAAAASPRPRPIPIAGTETTSAAAATATAASGTPNISPRSASLLSLIPGPGSPTRARTKMVFAASTTTPPASSLGSPDSATHDSPSSAASAAEAAYPNPPDHIRIRGPRPQGASIRRRRRTQRSYAGPLPIFRRPPSPPHPPAPPF